MSVSVWDLKGAERVRQIIATLGDTVSLKAAYVESAMGDKVNIQSCYQTARVLAIKMSSICGTQMKAVQGMHVLDQSQRAAKAVELLAAGPRAVFIDITPDHHFMVLSVSPTQVVIMQSYQDSYDLLQWLRAPESGYRKLDTFATDLKELVSVNKMTNAAAAVRLFAFATVAQTVSDIYLKLDSPSQILSLSYLDL